ncbi:hypothetical protein CY35_02G130500 [Sphagnum magellanicum]|nr:hypothetical protein CY35_02G130500 [Sphagnum magellanicum]KAH9572133.1 hypothetical protein CY35_02G130500 [Sphagnum magellanicum]
MGMMSMYRAAAPQNCGVLHGGGAIAGSRGGGGVVMGCMKQQGRLLPSCMLNYRFEGLRIVDFSSREKSARIGIQDSGSERRRRRRRRIVSRTMRGELGVVTCEKKVKVRLLLDHQVQFGESLALLGSAECAGSWQNKVAMSWTEAGWVAELEGKPGEKLEYKHVLITQNGETVWEAGPNRVLPLPAEGSFQLVTHWDCTQEESELRKEKEQQEEPESERQVNNVEEKPGNSLNVVEETASSFVEGWQGREVSFMRSNDHAHEKAGKWDTSGLDGAALHLVQEDQKASNWWRKLEVVRGLVMGELAKKQTLNTLVNVAIYLKWINTGQIRCYEDGQHYRPNKHAEISRRIFQELERMSSDQSLNPKELLVIRKIHPCLPAFKAEFTASVPLTRIRDIAHRNDIPHDLKQEIKHTIQNKLHRNAGPEDLVATELMLARVTRNPGEYSQAFVDEFRVFYGELKDFFNAGSLTEQLEGLRVSFDQVQLSVLDNFLGIKRNLDDSGTATTNGNAAKSTDSLISLLHALTSLRSTLLKGLESGLRNDASDEAIAMRQKWRLSEIGLEDYSFVLLSRLINALESAGGARWLADEARKENVSSWAHALGAIVLGLRQIGLSKWQQAECIAIENELQCWQAVGVTADKDTKTWALRLKATLDRARRLAETYTDTLLQLFPAEALKLGNALGIAENTVRTFTEAEIRASVVFQVAKLCSMLLKAVRTIVGGEGFDTLMPGKAVGRLIEVDRITPSSLSSSVKDPVILLVKAADGDEEVKAAGANVVGVILQHELPHLSHLGVRARQEKVVFVTCDDEDKVANLRGLINQTVKLEASSESVQLNAYQGPLLVQQKQENNVVDVVNNKSSQVSKEDAVGDEGKLEGAAVATLSKAVPIKQSSVVRSTRGVVLELSEATTENAGSKAAACGRLAVLTIHAAKVHSEQGVPAVFCVPPGKVIPFGAMEEALESSNSLETFQALVEQVEIAHLEGGELDKVCNELRTLVAAQRPARSVMDALMSGNTFSKDARLIVRSSANVEDLAGMSGAVSPIDRDEAVVQAEIAVGLGETLASGTRGTPWRLAVNKFEGEVKTLVFANFSDQLVVLNDGKVADGSMVHKVIDYSTQPLSVDPNFRTQIGQQLATVGSFLEQQFGLPQDIEGCIVGRDIYIVQARPQP